MIAWSRAPSTAAVFVRILVAWLIAMQPMMAGAAAHGGSLPFAIELCRGGPVPSDNAPADHGRDHAGCCLVACWAGAAVPPAGQALALAVLRLDAIAPFANANADLRIPRAGLGLQEARAPPA